MVTTTSYFCVETLLTRICNFPQHKFLKTFPSHIKFKTQHFISDQLSKVQLEQPQQMQKTWVILLDCCNRYLLRGYCCCKIPCVSELACVLHIYVFLAESDKSLPSDCNSLGCLPKYGWFPPRASSWASLTGEISKHWQ